MVTSPPGRRGLPVTPVFPCILLSSPGSMRAIHERVFILVMLRRDGAAIHCHFMEPEGQEERERESNGSV